jgi:hypothetical protein
MIEEKTTEEEPEEIKNRYLIHRDDDLLSHCLTLKTLDMSHKIQYETGSSNVNESLSFEIRSISLEHNKLTISSNRKTDQMFHQKLFTIICQMLLTE